MRRVRVSLGVMMGVAVALGLGTVAVGQSEAPSEPMSASWWTGSWTGTGGESGIDVQYSAYSANLGGLAVGEISADDLRAAGTMTQVQNVHYTESEDPDVGYTALVNGTVRIDNEEGAWVGTFTSYNSLLGGEEWYVMDGEEAYEGLTMIFRWLKDDSTVEGVILPAEFPSLPDPIQPPAE